MEERRDKSSAAVENLEFITGISIQEIERRARPLKRNPNTGEILYDPIEFARSSEEEEYIELLRQIRSFSGFLGENESLKQRIEEDRKIVFEELRTSHLELAHHLKNLLSKCPSKFASNIQYDVNQEKFSSSSQLISSKPQLFDIKHFNTKGSQFSLFTNLEKEEEIETWNDEYHIKNNNLNLSIIIGGNSKYGIISYIEKYGFYEGGGLENEYRLDPRKIKCLLTGIWHPFVLQEEILKCEKELKMAIEMKECFEKNSITLPKLCKEKQQELETAKKLFVEDQSKKEEEKRIFEEDIQVLEMDYDDIRSQLSENETLIEDQIEKIQKLQESLEKLKFVQL